MFYFREDNRIRIICTSKFTSNFHSIPWRMWSLTIFPVRMRAWQAGRRSLYASSSSSVWGENWKEFDILSGESAWRPWGDSHWSECWHCLEPSRLPWILNLHSKSFPIIRSSAQEITGRGVVYIVLQRIKVKSQKWPMKLSVTKYSMICFDCTSDTSHPHGRHWLINKWFWLAINIDE